MKSAEINIDQGTGNEIRLLPTTKAGIVGYKWNATGGSIHHEIYNSTSSTVVYLMTVPHILLYISWWMEPSVAYQSVIG